MVVRNTSSPVADLSLDHQLCFALYAASRAATGAYRDALQDLGLTYPQYLVMLALWETDGQSVGDLGKRLQLDSGTLSPLLARLDGSGFLKRSRPDKDGRRVIVRLTAAGDALRSEAESIQCALLNRIDLPSEDLFQLRSLALRLVESIHASTTTASFNPKES